jgi:hypothetical protein
VRNRSTAASRSLFVARTTVRFSRGRRRARLQQPADRHPGAGDVRAGQTCNGCHFSEVHDPQTGAPLNTGGFYQIAPINDTSADGTARLAPFIKDFEIPRRTKFMQNVLTCSGSGCAAGAEATFL